MTNNYEVTTETARRALTYIDPNERALWVKMGAALKSHFGEDGFSLFDDWSATAGNYDAKAAKTTWKGFKSSGGVTIGSLIFEAKRGGFDPKTQASNAPSEAQTAEAREKRAQERAAKDAAEALEIEKHQEAAAQKATRTFNQATPDCVSRYLGIKGVQAYGVRFDKRGGGVTVLVPLADNAGKVWNVQSIAENGSKLFLKGARVSGLYHLIGEYTGAGWLLVAEGYATAATLHEVTGYPVAVGFNAMNLKPVCMALRERFPDASILVCADNDKATEERTGKNGGVVSAQEAAACVGGCVAIPQGLPLDKSDFNDLYHLPVHAGGGEQVKQQVENAVRDAVVIVKLEELSGNDNHYQKNAPISQSEPSTDIEADTTTLKAVRGAGGKFERVAGGKPAKRKANASEEKTVTTRDAGGKFKHVPKHFTCDKNGVYFHETKDGEPRKIYVCSELHVTAKTRNADNDGWGYLLEFEDVSGNPKCWLMPASMLNADGATYRGVLLDMGLLIDTSSQARTLLNRYIQSSKVDTLARCATKTGWFDDAFVLPHTTIGESDGERVIFQSGRVNDSPFRQKGTLEDWRDNVAALCVGNSRLVFALCSAFAGVLLEPAGVQSGGFHFVGDSSVGKSTALFVAASVYGSRRRFVKTWRATDASLESTAEQHSDTLLILDELAQVDSKIVGDIVYMLGNEQGKGRNKNTGGARNLSTWRVLYLSSGEISLNDHMKTAGKTAKAGQEARLVNLLADAGKGHGLFDVLNGFEDGQSLAKYFDGATREFHGLAGIRFIEYAVQHIEELRETLKIKVQDLAYSWTPNGAHGQVSRVAQRFALVALAGELASIAGITGWAEGEATNGVKMCFDSWLEERGGAGNSELERMREQALGVISTNAARFTYWHRAHDSHAPNVSNRLGFKRLFDGDAPLGADKAAFMNDPNPETRFDASDCVEVYYVLPQAYKDEICKGFNPKAMAAYLLSIGYIKPASDGGATRPEKLPNMGTVRCYVFVHNMLNI